MTPALRIPPPHRLGKTPHIQVCSRPQCHRESATWGEHDVPRKWKRVGGKLLCPKHGNGGR